MIYTPKHFRIEEMVPESFFGAYRHRGPLLWMVFDQGLLITADALRDRYGKIEANTWLWGGQYQERGLRLWGTQTGAPLSQHLFGRALDVAPQETTAEEIRQDIRKPSKWEAWKYIRRIEEGTSWLHFDTGNWTMESGIWWVKPS